MAQRSAERERSREEAGRAHAEDGGRSRGNGRSPGSPTDLGGKSWGGVLKRSVKGFKDDNLTDWAAALTYYGILSIFPALIAIVSVVGLLGSSATQALMDNVSTVTP